MAEQKGSTPRSWHYPVGAIPTRPRVSHPDGIECCARLREAVGEVYTERLPGRNRKVKGWSLVILLCVYGLIEMALPHF